MSQATKTYTGTRTARWRKQLAPRRLLAQWIPLAQDVQSQNVRSVLIDGIGVGIAAAAAPYLPVFLARLGAQNFQVGLLTSMPALTGLLFAIPIGQFLARRRKIVPWYSRARFLVILCYALTGLVPFFVANQIVVAVLLIWLLATIPQTIVSVGFTVVMGGVAGPEGRFYLMSRRWSSLGVTTAVLVAVAGFVLEQLPPPLNYQIVFMILSMGGLVSFAFSRRIILPDQVAPASVRRLPLAHRLQDWLRQLRGQGRFVRTVGIQFIYRFGLSFALPLFPLYYVRVLNASDESIGLINTVQGLVLLGAYYFWTRVTKKRGMRFALLATTLAVAFYPIVLSFTQPIPLVIVVSLLAATFAAGIDLVFFEMVVASYPPDQAASYVGLQQTTVYVGNFIAPLVATAIATTLGIPAALMAAGVIRLIGCALFAIYVRE